VTRARRIEIVRGDLSHEPGSRARGVAALGGLAASQVEGRRALRAAHDDVSALLRAQRTDARVDGSRVLYVQPSLWLGLQSGGSVAHVAGVVGALAEEGYEIALAAAFEPTGVPPAVEHLRLAPPRRLSLPVESNLYRFSRTIPAQLERVPDPSFVYQRHALGSYAGAEISRARRVPLILEYNGSEIWTARHWSRPVAREELALAAEDASMRHAHLVVTVSQALADELARRGVEPERIVWHPNGVDPQLFDSARFDEGERRALRARYGIPDDALLVGFVGTFGEWHGVPVLARAIRRIAGDDPADLRFLLVGDGPTMPEVRGELGGLERVATLAGLVPAEEIPLHLAASDVLVSPHVPNPDGSPFFGSPTKLFEYMAAGKAIVASDLDQIGDVLRDGLAVLVRPGDADDLVRGIREAAGDEALRRELGARARARVLERYTWRRHVEAILERVDALR